MANEGKILRVLTIALVLASGLVAFESGVFMAQAKNRERAQLDLARKESEQSRKTLYAELRANEDVAISLESAQNEGNPSVAGASDAAVPVQVPTPILTPQPAAPVTAAPKPQMQVNSKRYPFKVPTNGIIGSQAGTYNGQLYNMTHRGIDIWSSAFNGGRVANHKGSIVYSACNGKVVNIYPPNASITIQCDSIPAEYDVPQRQVYTHYAHLGHAETKELYIEVHRGQRVQAGQKLGSQGDLSSYFPDMRNVHLHFSVFTGNSEVDPNGGALNPCQYIGGDCSRKGEIFRKGN